MFIQPISFLTMDGCRPLTTIVDTDFYTGKKVALHNRSVEHLRPRSKNGANNIRNYAMVDRFVNSERGNMPMLKWIKKHPDFWENMRNYCVKYWDLEILGVKHGQQVNDTIKKLTGVSLVEDLAAA